jgi:vacuolar-type H+-ATPase subunit I/STV1
MLLERVYAQGGAVDLNVTDPVHTRFNNLADIFGFLLNLFIGIGWALVFVMLALGFVQYVMSRGEKTAVESAQKWLTYAVIGGVGLFFISFVRRVLPQLLGADTQVLTSTGALTPF